MRIAAATAVLIGLGSTASVFGGFSFNFEEGRGRDGGYIVGLPGVSFVNTYGEPWRYADIQTGYYNVTSDDTGHSYGPGEYHMLGYVSAWAGREGARGRINFDEEMGLWFQTGYSSRTTFYLDAYDADGERIARAIGPANVGSPMGYLRVEAPVGATIAFVMMHTGVGGGGGGGDYWTVDNMSAETTSISPVPEPSNVLAGVLLLAPLGASVLRAMRRGYSSPTEPQ